LEIGFVRVVVRGVERVVERGAERVVERGASLRVVTLRTWRAAASSAGVSLRGW
jgi:hypothetical protein